MALVFLTGNMFLDMKLIFRQFFKWHSKNACFVLFYRVLSQGDSLFNSNFPPDSRTCYVYFKAQGYEHRVRSLLPQIAPGSPRRGKLWLCKQLEPCLTNPRLYADPHQGCVVIWSLAHPPLLPSQCLNCCSWTEPDMSTTAWRGPRSDANASPVTFKTPPPTCSQIFLHTLCEGLGRSVFFDWLRGS